MWLAEPAAHRYDWHWRLGPIPIRVHPGFWLLTGGLWLLQGARLDAGLFNLVSLALWTAVVFTAVLGHELGHALSARWRSPAQPRITLGILGGLTIGAAARTRRQELAMIAAGPLYNLALGLPALLLWWRLGGPEAELSPAAALALTHVVWVNVGWGVINALPVLPLDGGLFLEALLTRRRPATAHELTLRISLVVAVVAGVLLLLAGQGPAALVFLGLAFLNYQERRRGRDYF